MRLPDLPDDLDPDRWAACFASWLQQEDSVFDQDSMADWFSAAFSAASGSSPAASAAKAESQNLDSVPEIPSSEGVWVSYYHDRSAVVPFGSELEALRHAVGSSAAAKFVHYGKEILEDS